MAQAQENNNSESLGRLPAPLVWAWLLLLVALAAWIRVHGANDYYYSPDEAMHSTIAAFPTLGQVLHFAHYEIHPPVLYILCHYWMALFNDTDPAFVRALALVFGLPLILVYYRIGCLLNGQATGLCCAALIAFGNGCIIQSYVVRHYIIMLFFISLAFWCYLRWHDNRRNATLACYGLLCAIACLTHFSAIFDVLCIAAFESLRMLRAKAPFSRLARWALVNGAVGLMALYVYHLWQPLLVPLKAYFATHVGKGLFNLLMHTLFYPILASGYILPDYTASLILLVAQIWVIIAPPHFIRNTDGLRSALALNWLAYGLGMLLLITRLYPEPGTRHSIWVLPFVIPTAGWILADTGEWLFARVLKAKSLASPLLALVLLIGGYLLYDPEARFKDGSEYVWPKQDWQALTGYMSTLGPQDLIVTEKDDGIMLANLYPAMGPYAFNGERMAAVTPYGSTQILFNPYYPRNYSRYVWLATMKEAQDRHLFDGIKRLIFLRMAWSRSPLTDIMLCDKVDNKQIVTFPATLASHRFLTRNDIYLSWAAVMEIPAKPFLKDVLSPGGLERVCMNGVQDKVPDLDPRGLKTP